MGNSLIPDPISGALVFLFYFDFCTPFLARLSQTSFTSRLLVQGRSTDGVTYKSPTTNLPTDYSFRVQDSDPLIL